MSHLIESKFRKIGTRILTRVEHKATVRLDVRSDEGGEHFVLTRPADVDVRVVDVEPRDRHLLLTARRLRSLDEQTFLCGFDERHYFAAAIPESAYARDVQQAKDALKPQEVWDSIRENHVPMKDRDLRRTSGFLRQGEWFFLPRPWLLVGAAQVLKNEPIRRGNGKAHICENLHRIGGTLVLVSDAYPNGLTRDEHRRLPKHERRQAKWSQMVRDARVLVQGDVSHPDHETIRLPYWHQVVMNTETQSRAMRHLAFLD
jgi:hypothetical protein